MVDSQRIYDDFSGNDLDAARWQLMELPIGPDQTWRMEEPNAKTTLAEGLLTVEVAKFERSNDFISMLDNPKHLIMSTETFSVPNGVQTTFAMDLSVGGLNARPRDYRDAFAAMNLVDLSGGWVFDACISDDMIFALYERLAFPGVEDGFTKIVEAPFSGLDVTSRATHRVEIVLDPERRTAEWLADGVSIFVARDAVIPSAVNVGLGLFTLHPFSATGSASLHGQGIVASFGPLAISSQ